MRKEMTARINKLLYPILLIFMVMAFGTIGYTLIEGWGLLDSLYMTVITITTIGFKEVHVLSNKGMVFTVFLIFFSVGVVFYSLNNAARFIIEGELKDIFGRRRLQKMIKKLKGHYIVCGHGRMGKIICNELLSNKAPFVVIENSPPQEAQPEDRYIILQGDATNDEVLKMAGIDAAIGLISVLPTDAENLYVVLSSRGMNPSLNIVARAVVEGAERKLLRAGANRVVSPYHIGALRIAQTVLRPGIVDFIEFSTSSTEMDIRMEEIAVVEGSRLVGQTLSQSGIGRDLSIIIIAIRRKDGRMDFNPTHRSELNEGDKIIVIGEKEKLTTLEKIAGVKT